VLLVEQEIDYALRLTSRIYMLKRGAVQFERSSAEASVEELKEAYF
jgi:ABC-type branched-subunit amino acid transport system ATPase component